MLKVNNQNFEEIVLKSEKLVVVDFFATWCGPCQMLSPVLEELSKEITEATIIKVDVDEAPELAEKYGVYSIPNVVMIKDGKEVDRFVGFSSKAAVEQNIKKNL